MIIDCILDRFDNEQFYEDFEYDAKDFYFEILAYHPIFPELAQPILEAMDWGDNDDVVRELCNYITEQNYNHELCAKIKQHRWL